MPKRRVSRRFSKGSKPEDGFWSRAFAGFKAILPVLAGVVPFALIAGAAPIQEGISAAATIGMSLIVFAGVAQLVAAQLIGSGAAPVIVVFTAAVINLRLMMYSASLAPYLGEPPARWKALVSYLLTDQAYAVAVTRFSRESTQDAETETSDEAGRGRTQSGRIGYYLGAAVAMWVVWQIGTVSGIVLGARVPEALALDFAMPLVFLALMFSAVTSRASSVAAFGAGAMALIAAGLPLNLGLIAAIAAGVLAGISWPSVGGAFGGRRS